MEAINALDKGVKRIAFVITNMAHWRVRVLLYAIRPDRSKLVPKVLATRRRQPILTTRGTDVPERDDSLGVR